MIQKLHLKHIDFINLSHDKHSQKNKPYFHPGKSAVIKDAKEQVLGYVGLLHPVVKENLSIKTEVGLVELNLEALMELQSNLKPEFKPVPQYQYVKRDISLVVDTKIEAGKMLKSIDEMKETLVTNAEVIDIYEDAKEKTRKSITFRITISPQKATLKDEEINAIIEDIKNLLKKEFAAELRK